MMNSDLSEHSDIQNDNKRKYTSEISKLIRDKLLDGTYDFCYLLRLIDIQYGIVTINGSALYPDDYVTLEKARKSYDFGLTKTKKLVSQYSDRTFSAHIVCAEHFIDLDDLQNIYLYSYLRYSDLKNSDNNSGKISINKVFEMMYVELSCDMEYYLSHEDEMRKDLKREVNAEELNGEKLVKLEQELFYNQMLNLFGDDGVPDSFDTCDEAAVNVDGYKFEKALMLEDFRLFSEVNLVSAFAKRGNYYIFMEGDV